MKYITLLDANFFHCHLLGLAQEDVSAIEFNPMN
jgi:hypothetical protein